MAKLYWATSLDADQWARVESCEEAVAEARELGMSREGLYRLRQRLGMPVRQGGPVPVPEDWRERLNP